MKKVLPWALFIGVVYIVQSALLYPLSYDNISADLIMITVVFLTLLYGRYGLLFGFAGGLFQDLASGSFLGIHTFTLIIICLLVEYLSTYVNTGGIILPIYLVIGATVMNHLIINSLIFLLGYTQDIFVIVKALALSIIYNMIFTYPLWIIINKLKDTIDRWMALKTQ